MLVRYGACISVLHAVWVIENQTARAVAGLQTESCLLELPARHESCIGALSLKQASCAVIVCSTLTLLMPLPDQTLLNYVLNMRQNGAQLHADLQALFNLAIVFCRLYPATFAWATRRHCSA